MRSNILFRITTPRESFEINMYARLPDRYIFRLPCMGKFLNINQPSLYMYMYVLQRYCSCSILHGFDFQHSSLFPRVIEYQCTFNSAQLPRLIICCAHIFVHPALSLTRGNFHPPVENPLQCSLKLEFIN